MNITETFRRKNPYSKPILIFKELYRDYYKQSSPFNYKNPNVTTSASCSNFKNFNNKNILISQQAIPQLKKTRSAEQLTLYLQKHGNTNSQFYPNSLNDSSIIKRSKSSKNTTIIFHSSSKNHLIQSQNDKRSYFNNNFTKSHPFFQKTKDFFKQKKIEQKENQNPPILPDIFKQSTDTLKKPVQKRIQLQQLKHRLIDRKQRATQKFSKIRHNYLIKKNYRQETQESGRPLQRLSFKNSFQVTKQNIFPQSLI